MSPLRLILSITALVKEPIIALLILSLECFLKSQYEVCSVLITLSPIVNVCPLLYRLVHEVQQRPKRYRVLIPSSEIGIGHITLCDLIDRRIPK